jgi:predicted Zn finger-like uncharacterized protein
MRLICPNCGADYDIPEGMIPADGRHVQCSSCHTRWFVRGTARAALSEDQILTRLENWRPRPAPVPAAPAETPAAVAPPPPAARPRPSELRVVPAAEADPEPSAVPPAPRAPAQRELPAKPADRPTVARPAPVPHAPARPAPRLDLGGPRMAPAPEPPAPAPRSRFLHGVLLVPALALVAFAAYRLDDEIAATVPAAAPALDAYAATIDGWRAALEEVIAPRRPDRSG